MNDQNVLRRHIKPVAKALGLHFVTGVACESLRNLVGTVGCRPKKVQGQMRHSRISTTMDIYAQIVPAAQRQALGSYRSLQSGCS